MLRTWDESLKEKAFIRQGASYLKTRSMCILGNVGFNFYTRDLKLGYLYSFSMLLSVR